MVNGRLSSRLFMGYNLYVAF
ncbi:MAG: hypothetical protein ACD_87C00132G0001, partial [uncultured bacterium]